MLELLSNVIHIRASLRLVQIHKLRSYFSFEPFMA